MLAKKGTSGLIRFAPAAAIAIIRRARTALLTDHATARVMARY
jgi:hypothetical protein